MKYRTTLAAAAIALAGITSQANAAAFLSGNMLLERMNSQASYDRGMAMGYVVAIADSLEASRTMCTPEGVTAGQMRDTVQQFLQNSPENRHYTADSIVRNVLSTVWPCAKSKGSSL